VKFTFKYVLQLLLIGMFHHYSLEVFSQLDGRRPSGVNKPLKVYADSLDRLVLGHRTTSILALTDSLLRVHSNLVSPEIIASKAARANAYELLYNFESALEIYNELIAILESSNFVEEEIDVVLSLARVYETVGKKKQCLESLERAFRLIEEYNKPGKLSRYYIRLASYQRIYEDKYLAKEYAAQAVQLGERDGVARSIGDGNLLLGLLAEDYDQSIIYLKKASNQFLELGDYIGSVYQELNIASLQVKYGSYEDALDIIKEVDKYTVTIDDNERVYYQLQIHMAEISEQIYEKQGEKDSVISALRKNKNYTNLFGNIVNQDKINQLIYENEIRQEKEKLETVSKNNSRLGMALLVLLSALGLLSFIFIKNRKQRLEIQEQSNIIQEQYSAVESLYHYQTTLLSEVHHRIKNNLQLIKSLLTLQKTKSSHTKEEEVLEMLSHRVTSISLLHEQLYNTKEFDKIDVDHYVKDLLKNFMSLVSEKNVAIDYQVDDIELNLETITPLGLIWSELISNSIKYNKYQPVLHIIIKLEKQGDAFIMHYSDSGKGYTEGVFKATEQGMGFIIINSLSKQLGADTKSYNKDGANYYMKFKEKIISPL